MNKPNLKFLVWISFLVQTAEGIINFITYPVGYTVDWNFNLSVYILRKQLKKRQK